MAERLSLLKGKSRNLRKPGSCLNNRLDDCSSSSRQYLQRPDFFFVHLLTCRIKTYISKGWSDDHVDPDNGGNMRKKLMSAGVSSVSSGNIPSVNVVNAAFSKEQRKTLPEDDDPAWMADIDLRNLPDVSFATIYAHLVER